MSKVDRNNPKRSSASESAYTLFEFEQDFPDDAACLEFLVGMLYPDGIFCPKCDRVTKHHRDSTRPSYTCQFCGRHEHPMVGTIFENSATSLRLWFYAMYLMASTRCGISAKQLERELGVTYKTAWRMFKQIRSLFDQDTDPALNGTVELDEVYLGGKAKWMHQDKREQRITGRGSVDKTPVFGMARRGTKGQKDGKVMAKVVTDAKAETLLPHVRQKVLPKSTVYTDEWRSYDGLGKEGYDHSRVHHTQGIYVSGDAHVNTVEGFWSLLRRGIGGAYHAVSDKYLQSYLDEYVFRYNNRDAGERGMFSAMLARIEKAPEEPRQLGLPEEPCPEQPS
jgi:transposase-like protein